MQDRPNYPYNDYSSLKDPNQQGQNSNKQGKKSNHNKYYNKTGTNKNNNLDEMNINNTDHNPNYRHTNRYPRNTYQEIGNRGNQQNYKKKKGKKRDNNNELFYQGNNNAIEVGNQMKEDYNEQNNNMNLGGNNHPNLYGKNYNKKSQGNIYTNNNLNLNNNVLNNNMNNLNMNNSLGSMNSNTNSTGTSNLSNLNLTPQSKNQITSPLMNYNNSPSINKLPQQNQQNIYLNPKLVDSLRKKDNDQDMSLKDEKSSENLSEDNMNIARDFQQGNKMGPNAIGNLGNNLTQIDLNKNQNDFINQQEYMNQMNQKFIPQQNNFYMPFNNINGINNLGNTTDNTGNLPNLNSINNINNLNPGNCGQIPNLQTYTQSPIHHMGPSVPNIGNMNPMTNLSLNNFQRQYYDNNNKIYNPNPLQQNFNYQSSQDESMIHKKLKKTSQNKSPLDPSNLSNQAMNLGNNLMNNLNYNGPKNNFIKNNNNNIPMKMTTKLSQSSKTAKNTIPNFLPNDNINIIGNQNQNIPQLLNMGFGQMNNRNIYLQQNIQGMRNPHMNQGYINNNHINIVNNQINNKDFQTANFNPNMMNKKNYQKFNTNTFQVQKHNNTINNNQIFQKNKNNVLNSGEINNNLLNNNINLNNNKNFGLKSGNENNILGSNKSNFSMGGSTQAKQFILCLNIKLGDKSTKTIKIKNWNECPTILDELKTEGKINNDKEKKLIQEKISKTYELTKKIFEFGIKNYTYKNLCEIYHKLNYENNNPEKKMIKKKFKVFKRNKSFKEFEDVLNDEKKLKLEHVRNVGSLNITF